MELRSPLFILLFIPAFLILFYARKNDKGGAISFSWGGLFQGLRETFKLKLTRNILFLRLAGLILIILALSRPLSPAADSKIESEGIDIVLALDCSTSMLAEDFKLAGVRRNRLDVVKDVVKDFVKARHRDRIGIIAFAARAYTVCPLTLDYGWLLENLSRVRTGLIEDGTAIGSGLASSLNRLKDSDTKSKVVILLTDGRNNTGDISPSTAAEAAMALKIKVYTIGAGTKGLAPYPVKDFFGNTVYQSIEIDIDEDTLKGIADKTRGRYFRATDTESLREIYKEIERMEKTKIEEKGYLEYNELFPYFLIPGAVLLLLEIILNNTVFRRIP